MELIGTVESLWRYPVKSMRGEELRESFVGFPGVYGDRLYAFRNSVALKRLHLDSPLCSRTRPTLRWMSKHRREIDWRSETSG